MYIVPPSGQKITASDFSKELDEIEKLQKEFDDIFFSENILVKIFKYYKMNELYNGTERRMHVLFGKEIIPDTK